MSVKKDPSGRRYIAVEAEVPGTPEEVWQAIATGAGITSWFVPTQDRDDGSIVMSFGPGMDSVAKKTAWDPPRRFAAESEGMGPGAPPMATEWTVEARSGDTCVVRVVHSLFASTDDWDNELESIESGWPAFLRILRLYLTHFRGMHGATIQLLASTSAPEGEAWDRLTRSLGVAGAAPGERRRTAGGAPALAGIVESTGGHGHDAHEVLVRLDEPAPGFAHVCTVVCGGPILVSMRLYLYGAEAAAIAARDEPLWQARLAELFPQQTDQAALAGTQ
jgi:uncharacterized protein YndB with AHSA1/START domain